ncbi:hypothetical protein AVEN_255259-1 [Araneus ventricosus]|uniref:Uncharacterized protein n=1 Tax=Araneus ventricosus TaxID=182803 RepID=A0A4Y2B9V2_ARAVE|nr:hypothetical protein AVEN_255259-1 [Araneus ventricosus]
MQRLFWLDSMIPKRYQIPRTTPKSHLSPNVLIIIQATGRLTLDGLHALLAADHPWNWVSNSVTKSRLCPKATAAPFDAVGQ